MSTRKMALHESERAPRMRMQQWMMNVVLEKDKQRLSKSEKLVCSKINMEQKILCKRYRKKIQESKLAFARITQNKELEQEILEQRSLNTDIVTDMDNDDMLRRVWSAGSQKFLENRRRLEILNSRKFLRMDSDSSLEEDDKGLKRKSLSARPSTAGSRPALSARPLTAGSKPLLSARPSTIGTESKPSETSRPTTAVSIASPGFIKRPFTAIESQYLSRKEDDDEMNESIDSTETDTEKESECENTHYQLARPVPNSPTRQSVRRTTSFAKTIATEKVVPRASHLNISHSVPRPSTRLSRSASLPASRSPRPSITALSRKASKVSECQSIGTLFQGERRPTLLDIHKDKIRDAKYEDKIKKFGNDISIMRAKDCPVSDYYTERLRKQSVEQNAQKTLSFEHLIDGGVPPEEYKRWCGNTQMKAITVKSLHLDKQPKSKITPTMY